MCTLVIVQSLKRNGKCPVIANVFVLLAYTEEGLSCKDPRYQNACHYVSQTTVSNFLIELLCIVTSCLLRRPQGLKPSIHLFSLGCRLSGHSLVLFSQIFNCIMRLFTSAVTAIISLSLLHIASADILSSVKRRHTSLSKGRADLNRSPRELEKRFDNSRFTFYNAGLGACGTVNSGSDFVSDIAPPHDEY